MRLFVCTYVYMTARFEADPTAAGKPAPSASPSSVRDPVNTCAIASPHLYLFMGVGTGTGCDAQPPRVKMMQGDNYLRCPQSSPCHYFFIVLYSVHFYYSYYHVFCIIPTILSLFSHTQIRLYPNPHIFTYNLLTLRQLANVCTRSASNHIMGRQRWRYSWYCQV